MNKEAKFSIFDFWKLDWDILKENSMVIYTCPFCSFGFIDNFIDLYSNKIKCLKCKKIFNYFSYLLKIDRFRK